MDKRFGLGGIETLVVARHGHDEDLSLTELGAEQARRIGRVLASRIADDDLVTVIASDTRRTVKTARIIAEEIGYDPNAVIENRTLAENCSFPTISLQAIGEELEGDEGATFLIVVGHEPQTDGVLRKMGYGARACEKGEANLITSQDYSVERIP
jgi:phosphohistidine phosphatase SixA